MQALRSIAASVRVTAPISSAPAQTPPDVALG